MSVIYPAAVWQLKKTAAGRTQQDWDNAYAAVESDERADITNNRLGSLLSVPGAPWVIYRDVARFVIPSPISVGSAYIVSRGVYCNHTPTSGYMYDGTSLLGTKADYGDMLNLTTLLGTWYAPQVDDAQGLWHATFTGAGCDFLESKAGGNADIAFYSTDQPYPPPPDTFDSIWVVFWSNTDAKFIINSAPGFIWVEGTKLAYIDGYYLKRLKEGTLTGTTGKIAGHLSAEGDYLHYIDSSGAERRILGSTTGLSGKQPSQISINTKNPMYGTHLCYIDSSGAERCFEGTAS